MDTTKLYSDYDAFYFSHCCTPGLPYERSEHWLSFFDGIAEHITQELKPASVLDAGCAMGFLVESLRKRGVQAFGMDISKHAIQNVHPDVQPYCWVGSVSEPFPQRYDLIVSIEVLEHLPPPEAEKTIRNFCLHSERALFSSTPQEFREATHINVQPVEFWAKLFARNGFFHDLDYDASYITHWAMLFNRTDKTNEHLVQQYERKIFQLYREKWELRTHALETRRSLAENHQIIENLKEQLVNKGEEARILQGEHSLVVNSRGWKLLEKLRHTWLYSFYARTQERRSSQE